MGGFLTFVVIVAGIVWLFRYWRRRELERFHETDKKMLREIADKAYSPEVASSDDAIDTSARHEVEAAPEIAEVTPVPPPAGATLRPAALDEIHQHVLMILEDVLGDRYRIFVNKPLADFIRLEKGPGELFGRTVSFLACEPDDFTVVFALTLRGAGQGELAKFQYLERLLAEVGVPLAALPMTVNLSRAEIEEKLEALTPSPLPRHGNG